METKIKKEQLELIQKQQVEVNDALRNLGILEMQRNGVVKQVFDKQEEIEKTKQELEKEYGKVNINLSDGTYSPIEEEIVEEKESGK
tara:strand:+ start:242 stop:502 length:261 start_codon:yes stop_codon:yes gene_type:complete